MRGQMNTSNFIKLFLYLVIALALMPSFAIASEAVEEVNKEPTSLDFTMISGIPPNDILKSLNNVLSSDEQITRGGTEVQVYKRWSPAVVLIQTANGFGSGAIINDSGNIITNWHVIDGTPVVRVIFKPQKDSKNNQSTTYAVADVIRVNKAKDLALLKLNRLPQGIEPIILSSANENEVGTDVHAIGHPAGESWSYTRGFISQVRPKYEWSYEDSNHKADIIQIQTPIGPGSSGGPLLSSEGKLLGVNAFSSAELDSIHYAVSANEVIALLATPGDQTPSSSPSKSIVLDQLCDTDVVQEFRNEKKKIRVQLFDLNCDGKIDTKFIRPDDENEPFTLSIDGSDSEFAKAVLFDENRDGNWDYALFDLDGNKSAELIGYYKEGEDEPYRYEKYLKHTYLP
jgi:S1-C subfamily serine protease